jgi:predicted nucleotidyltransferase
MGISMAFGIREKDLKTIQDILSGMKFVREAKVFGSRALNQFRRNSDLDLAVTAPDATAEQWQSLREALEEAPVVFDVDLLRLNTSTPQTLRAKISREGKDLFKPFSS